MAKSVGGARVFEYGAGMSTVWFSSVANSIVSVESNSEWHNRISYLTAHLENVQIKLVENPNDYAEYIDNIPGLFDIVVVDGVNREHCVRRSVSKLRVGGLLIADNTDTETELVPLACSLGEFHIERFAGYAPGLFHPNETSILTKIA